MYNFEMYKARRTANLTHAALAKITGIKIRRVGYIEQGLTKPKVDEAFVLAKALNCPIEIFLSPDVAKQHETG